VEGAAPAGIDREWLERTLRAAFPDARLAGVREREVPAVHSDVRRLELAWERAPADGPQRLVWKRPRHDDREMGIYRVLASRPGLPVPRCLAADAGGLLLEDLSGTHEPPVARDDLLAGRGVPPGRRAERVAEALADLHAAFWEDPALGRGELAVRDWFRDAAAHARHVTRRRREWAAFREREPGTPFRDTYERALDVLERLWTPEWEERVARGRGLTLVQGDAYLNQFLVPRDGDGPARVLDFGDATANPGAWDLAFALATFWTRGQRADGGRERALLRSYTRRLTGRGVTVTEDDVRRDYRWMVAYLVFDPVWNATDGSSRTYWEPKMRCLTAAWHDLDCAALPG